MGWFENRKSTINEGGNFRVSGESEPGQDQRERNKARMEKVEAELQNYLSASQLSLQVAENNIKFAKSFIAELQRKTNEGELNGIWATEEEVLKLVSELRNKELEEIRQRRVA